MRDFRILFDGVEKVSLPDGLCLGVVGEHNAVQLVVMLPDSMIVNMDYHTITIGGIESARIVSTSENVDGAFRVGNVIYQPLTATYTTQRIVDVSVTAYRQVGDSVLAVDKTPTVYGLQFEAGQKIQMIGGLAAEVAALEHSVEELEESAHTHENKQVIDRIAGDADDLTYGGKIVPLIEPDDVTLLGFETYETLIVRDDATNTDGIQDVPVYTGGTDEICRLTDGTNYIALQEVRNEISATVYGMPVRVLTVRMDGTSYYYVGAPWLQSDGTTVPKGWRNGNAPVIADFTPSSFIVNGTTYTESDTMPDDALSALRSLSQCVNVSADAMGAIRIPDDAVVRFAGNVEPNRKYYFTAILGSEISFTLPTVPFTTDDAQFVIYLNCENYVDLVFPNGTKFVGGTLPNSDAGSHKLIGCWLKDAGVWAVGGVDYTEVSA